MKFYKIFTILLLALSLFYVTADAQSKKKKTVKKSKPVATKPALQPPTEVAISNLKILVEGSQSKVTTPFIFVARDAETYALLRGMVEGLPESSGIDFSQSAVVAAFAGERNTGGWSVKILAIADKIAVDVIAPPKGAMNMQVITYPFQVVSVPLVEGQPLNVEAAAAWMSRMQNFKVTKGDFEYTGGFAGRSKKFNADGTIGVLTFGDYATYFFNLTGKGSEKARKLVGAGSGARQDTGFEIARLDAGTFAEIPHPPVKATGAITGKKLTLNFESLPPTVADGYMLKGRLEAAMK